MTDRHRQGGEGAEHEAPVGAVHRDRGDDGSEPDAGAQREVDAPDEHDDELRQRRQPEDHHLARQVRQVVHAAEVVRRDRGVQREAGDDHPDGAAAGGEPGELLRPHCPAPTATSCRDARVIMRSTDLLRRVVVSELADDPAVGHHEDPIRQAEHLDELGGDDDDGRAVVGERAHQRVDLLLRPDVDPARRLVEDQHLGVEGEPLGEHDLLLVAARERPGGFAAVGSGADVELADRPWRRSASRPAIDRMRPATRSNDVERDVRPDALGEREAFDLAVLGDERNAGPHRVGRAAERGVRRRRRWRSRRGPGSLRTAPWPVACVRRR